MFAARKIEREGVVRARALHTRALLVSFVHHTFSLDFCFLFKVPAAARRFREVLLFVASGTNVGSRHDIIIY